jgi:Kef-type K+ transport system membrane component KefB
MLVALPVYELLAPDTDYLPFALFMGVSMSVTAFPVLARILVERRMLRRPIGAVAMAGAAIDDVTAWGLLALATAVAGAGSGLHALVVVGLAGAFTAAMFLVLRPLLGRVSTAYDEAGHVPPIWIATIFVGVLLAAYVSQQIGIAAIFGAFIVGLIMPRHAGLTSDVSDRLEDFVVTVLLPLFFVVTGMRVKVGALDDPLLWGVTLLLIAVAVVGKWVGAMLAAQYAGFSWRDSSVLGALSSSTSVSSWASSRRPSSRCWS